MHFFDYVLIGAALVFCSAYLVQRLLGNKFYKAKRGETTND